MKMSDEPMTMPSSGGERNRMTGFLNFQSRLAKATKKTATGMKAEAYNGAPSKASWRSGEPSARMKARFPNHCAHQMATSPMDNAQPLIYTLATISHVSQLCFCSLLVA